MAALRMKVRGFPILTNDEYVRLAATINKQLQINISDVNLEVVDYQFASARDARGTNSTNEPKPKRPKNKVLDNSIYAELSTAFNKNYRSNISRKDIAFMDITLQNHRAVNIATQLMNNPVVDITGDHQKSGQPTAAVGTTHATANHASVTPIAVPTIKNEPSHPKSRRTLFSKPRATTRTFEWQGKPTNERNHCIDTAAFLNTLPTVFHTAQNTIDLYYTYTNNPRATLETLLKILDANVPHEFMDTMFATDHTVSPNTINLIFRKHNADKHFQFRDYATAVTDRNLTGGITGLFTGLSGSNFSGQKGFTMDRPLLCQMEMAAPDRGTHKKSYQWILFYPRMNLVSTCHNYSINRHAWTLGKETIAALAENDESFINTRLGKLAFPHKQDNVKSRKFVSTVFIGHNNSNFSV
jgi:hypothetical protein